MKSAAQIRFEEAREKLASTLQNIENTIIEKIRESAIHQQIDVDERDSLARQASMQAKIIEQDAIIEKLNNEINKMQKSIEEIGKESEFSKEKNRFLADKIFKFKSQGSNFIQAIETDLARIHEIIKE